MKTFFMRNKDNLGDVATHEMVFDIGIDGIPEIPQKWSELSTYPHFRMTQTSDLETPLGVLLTFSSESLWCGGRIAEFKLDFTR